MSSAKKKPEGICNKCTKQPDCEYKPNSDSLTLIRCLDFSAKENSEEKK